MKSKWIAAVAVLTLTASIAVAAPHGDGRGKRGHGEFGAKFAEKLNLTDAQKAQIKAIRQESRQQNEAFFQSFRQSMQDLREAKKANDTAKADSLKAAMQPQREQMKQLRDAEKQRILSVLTAEQRMQWEQLKAQRGERRHQH